jgi:hypothetical protein
MRSIFSFLLCLCTGLASAQTQPVTPADSVRFPLDTETKRITFTEVVAMPGVSQAELYTRAKVWFATTFKAPKLVVQADEKETGIIQGESWAPIQVHYLGPKRPASELRLWCTIKFAFKDGRYRYEITDLATDTAPTPAYPTSAPRTPVETTLAKLSTIALKNPDAAREFKQETSRSASYIESLLKTGMTRPAAGKSDW